MTFRKKESNPQITIDIDGPDGNAFVILSYAKRLCSRLGMNYDELKTRMTSGDYAVLIAVFEMTFPFVVIESENEEFLQEIANCYEKMI